ncbi:MAG: hypothetical protein Q8N42_01095 [bacterium]|nr:hypothetical protein [bacterium]
MNVRKVDGFNLFGKLLVSGFGAFFVLMGVGLLKMLLKTPDPNCSLGQIFGVLAILAGIAIILWAMFKKPEDVID